MELSHFDGTAGSGEAHVVLRMPCRPKSPNVGPMNTFSVQYPVTQPEAGDLADVVAAMRQAAVNMTAACQPVTVLHTTYVPAEQVCLSLVAADDAATVMEVLRRAGSISARVLPAVSL